MGTPNARQGSQWIHDESRGENEAQRRQPDGIFMHDPDGKGPLERVSVESYQRHAARLALELKAKFPTDSRLSTSPMNISFKESQQIFRCTQHHCFTSI